MFKVVIKDQININTILILSTIFLFALILLSLPESEAADNARDVLVMYAGSLVKIFENDIVPSFSNQTGLNLVGEGKGSVQISNMILDGFRRHDVFLSADTLPIEKLLSLTILIVLLLTIYRGPVRVRFHGIKSLRRKDLNLEEQIQS